MPNKNAQITAEYKQAIAEFQAELARLVENLRETDALLSDGHADGRPPSGRQKGAEHERHQRKN